MARLAPHAHAFNDPQSSGFRGCPLLTSPIIPCRRPAPLSACILTGRIIAYAQPLASTCCCQVRGVVVLFAAEVSRGGAGGLNPGGNTNPNSMITGTGPFAVAGTVSVRSISTLIAGYELLSA